MEMNICHKTGLMDFNGVPSLILTRAVFSQHI